MNPECGILNTVNTKDCVIVSADDSSSRKFAEFQNERAEVNKKGIAASRITKKAITQKCPQPALISPTFTA